MSQPEAGVCRVPVRPSAPALAKSVCPMKPSCSATCLDTLNNTRILNLKPFRAPSFKQACRFRTGVVNLRHIRCPCQCPGSETSPGKPEGDEPRGVMSQRLRSQARSRKTSEICSQRLFRKRAQASKFLTHAGVIELQGPRKSATGTPRMLESQRMSSESVTAKKAR